MSDTTVNPVNASAYFGQTAAPKKGTLDMSTFLNLLVTQLQNQNPLEPMDDAAFYGQIAQLGQVQGMQKLNASADLGQAQELLGKTVTAIRPTTSETGKQGDAFTGTVSKIVFKNGNQFIGVQEPDGGTVEVQVSAIKNVLPTVDVAGASNLIGKVVAGTTVSNGSSKSVVGTVLGITAEGGLAIAQVQDASGATVAIPVGSLTQIASKA